MKPFQPSSCVCVFVYPSELLSLSKFRFGDSIFIPSLGLKSFHIIPEKVTPNFFGFDLSQILLSTVLSACPEFNNFIDALPSGAGSTVVLSLLGNLSGIVSSLVGLCSTSSWTAKTLHVGTLGLNLSTIISLLVDFKIIESPWQSIKDAMASVISFLQNSTLALVSTLASVIPNASVNTAMPWVKLAAFAVIATIGLCSSGVAAKPVAITNFITNLNNGISALTCLDKLSEPLKSIFAQLFGESETHEVVVLQSLVDEANKLVVMPIRQLKNSPANVSALETLPERISKALATLKATGHSNSIRALSSMLIALMHTVNSRLSEVKLLNYNAFRPDPVAVLLEGRKACGKSRMMPYLSQLIRERMGYSHESQYQLNRSPDAKYFNTYLGQEIAYVDEFLFDPPKDSVLSAFNNIFSSNPYIIQGAGLTEKKQFFDSRLVLMTTNKNQKNVLAYKDSESASAIWSRIMWVNVSDPIVEAHPDPRFAQFTHRASDFSHLTLTIKPHKGINEFGDSEPITVNALVDRLVFQLASRELAYIDQYLRATPQLPKLDAEDMISRIKFLQRIVDKDITIPDTIASALSIPALLAKVQPNAGAEFCVFRLQGPGGSGKSTVAAKFTTKLSHLIKLPVTEVPWLPSTPKTTPQIYVLDDILTKNHYLDYLQFLNDAHKESIFFIITNDTILPSSCVTSRLRHSLSHFKITPTTLGVIVDTPPQYYDLGDVYDGLRRRLGLPGVHYTPRGFEIIESRYSMNVLCSLENFKVISTSETVILNETDLFDAVYKRAVLFHRDIHGATIVRASAPVFSPDITITANTEADLLSVLSDKQKIVGVLLGRNTNVSINYDVQKLASVASVLDPDHFVIPPNLSIEQFENTFIKMALRLLRLGANLSLHVETPTFRASYFDGKVYFPTRLEASLQAGFPPTDFDLESDYYYHVGNQAFTFKLKDVAQCLIDNSLIIPAYHIELLRNEFISLGAPKGTWFAVCYGRATADHVAQSVAAARSRASTWKWIGAATAVLAIGITIYSTTNFLKSFIGDTFEMNSKKPSGNGKHKNLTDEEYNKYQEEHDEMRAKMTGKMSIGTGDKYSQKFEDEYLDYKTRKYNEPVQGKKWSDFEDDDIISWYKNSRRTMSDSEKTQMFFHFQQNPVALEAFADYFKDCPLISSMYKRWTKANPNAVRNVVPVSPDKSIALPLIQSLEKNIVQVYSEGGRMYGIALKERLVMTVAHMVPLGEDKKFYARVIFDENDGVVCYDAKLVHIDRKKDLAILQLPNTCRAFPNITNKFRPFDEVTSTHRGIFAQFTRGNVAQHYGSVFVSTKTEKIPSNDPTYQFEENITRFFDSSFNSTLEYIRPGDCGLPLLGQSGNDVFLLGFHNAYSSTKLLFTWLSTEVLNSILSKIESVSPNAAVDLKQIIVHGEPAYVTPEIERVISELRPDGFLAEGIHSFGSSFRLRTFQKRTKPHKLILRTDNLETVPQCTFAPMHPDDVEDTSELYINRISKRPSIAFTQLKKYGEVKQQFCPDEAAFKRTFNYLRYYYQKNYGECRILTESEVINGVLNRKDELFHDSHSLDMKTSSGFILDKVFGCPTKGDVFVDKHADKPGSQPYYVINEDIESGKYLRSTMDAYWEALGQNKICVSGAKACLKFELINKEKASKGGTRLFQACDLDRIILRGRLTGSLRIKSMQKRAKCYAKAGLNVYKEASDIVKFMEEISGDDYFGDFKRFDKSLLMKILSCYAATRYILLPKDEQTTENYNRIMAEQVGQVRSLQLCEGGVFSANRGNLSGQSDTTTINDYANAFCFVYSLFRKLQSNTVDIQLISNEHVEQLFRLATLGDDNMSRFKYEVGMTFQNLQDFMAELGMELTDSGKGLNEDDTFLSRVMKRDPIDGLVYPALKKTSIERLLHFVVDLKPEFLQANFEMAMNEAALWNKTYYDLIVRDVIKQCANLDEQYGTLGTQIKTALSFPTYEFARMSWSCYIRGTNDYPSLTVLGTEGSENFLATPNVKSIKSKRLPFLRRHEFIDSAFDYPSQQEYFKANMANFVNRVKEYYDSHPLLARPIEMIEQVEGIFKFSLFNNEINIAVQGRGRSLSLAKMSAYQNYCHRLFMDVEESSPFAPDYSIQKVSFAFSPSLESELDDLPPFDFDVYEPNYSYSPQPFTVHLGITPNTASWTGLAPALSTYFNSESPTLPGMSTTVPQLVYNSTVAFPVALGEAGVWNTLYMGTDAKFSQLPTLGSRPIMVGCHAISVTEFLNLVNDDSFTLISTYHGRFSFEKLTYDAELDFFFFYDAPFTYSFSSSGDIEVALSIYPSLSEENFIPNMDANGTEVAGSKAMIPVIPNIPSDKGNTSGSPPVHDDQPSSSTVASAVNLPNTEQIRATRDMPSQIPLMSMVGGPPNMSTFNMYQDDYLNLVYREFDLTTVTVQGGQAKGTIVASFPYGLNLLNPYAQTWARLHKRYNGRIRLTFSMSAVPMLKGNVLIGVVRNMPPSGTTTFNTATLQKINWALLNLNGSGDYSFDIGDARQANFYRNTSEDPIGSDPTDLSDRPGIIVVVYTTISNQFGGDADTSVVFNIRSAAISPAEDPVFGFYAYEPVDITTQVQNPNEIPSAVFLNDILPQTANRSMFLDGNKIVVNDYLNLNGTSPGTLSVHPICGPTTASRLSTEPLQLNNNRALIYGSTIPPAYLRFQVTVINGDIDSILQQATTGNLIENEGLNNEFLGYSTFLTPVNNPFLEVVDDEAIRATHEVATALYVLNYQRGYIYLYDCTFTTGSARAIYMRRLFPNGLTMENAPISLSAAFPTSTLTLPSDYYNVVVATDGQTLLSAPINQLPVLKQDMEFVSAFYKLRTRFFAETNSLFAMDLVDYRDGTQIGTLCSYGSQVVLRTLTNNPGRSHFRITIDLQYLQLSNPRLVQVVPNSLSASYLQLFEPASVSPLALMKSRLSTLPVSAQADQQRLIQMMEFLLRDDGEIYTPNCAMAAAMISGGALSGLGNGIGSYFSMMNENQQKALDRANRIGAVNAQTQGALKVAEANNLNHQKLQKQKQNFELQMKGFDSALKVPGAMINQRTGSMQNHPAYAYNDLQTMANSPPVEDYGM
ncbi:putative polyprotein [Myrmica rubra picorna-like virus 1]|nr:putative polyprotein [Myrmica rubra picorna-like virus 1]